jgi:DNA-binding MarR family transcriptional regulator
MSNNSACLDPGQLAYQPSREGPNGSSGSLVTRYGAAAMEDGYVAIPQVVLHYRRAMGITPGEWDYLCEIFRYWRSSCDPYPSVETLAAGLACDPSTIRRYRLSLEDKGLLRVYRDENHNHYDLSKLIAAAVTLAQAEQCTPAAPCKAAPATRAKPHAKEEDLVKEDQDFDKTPTPRTAIEPVYAEESVNARTSQPGSTAPLLSPTLEVTEKNVLAATLGPISAEFGDDSPASSVTRALHMRAELRVSLERFLEAVTQAARRVRETAPTFSIIGPSGKPQGIHYFFGVLKRELRGGNARAQRQRPESRQQVRADYWANQPAPAPIQEAHPIWRAVLENLQPVITPANFQMWFACTRVLAQEGMVLRVAVPTPLVKTWLEKRLCSRVSEALRHVGHGDVRVEYVVDAAA